MFSKRHDTIYNQTTFPKDIWCTTMETPLRTLSEDHRWLRATFQCLRCRSNQWCFFTRVEVDLTRCEAAPLARPQEPMCFSASFRVLWTSGLLCVRVAPPPPVGVRDEDDTFLISSVCIFFSVLANCCLLCGAVAKISRHHTYRQRTGPSNTRPP